MEIRLLAVYSRCVTIELTAPSCYTSPAAYTVELDGKVLGERNTNVFTLYGLTPGTEHTVHALGTVLHFATRAESCCIRAVEQGAVGDGKTDCTKALQSAIDACTPGGTVLVEAGVYSTGPLFLKSGVTLYLEKDAVLRGLTQRAAYPILQGMVFDDDMTAETNYGTWEGNPLDCFASLITAIDAEDVAVLGEGTLDGNAQNGDWWQNPKVRNVAWRPRTVYLCRCRRVALAGITVCNSPSWTVHPYYCDDVKILDAVIRNPAGSPNTDGIDPESCSEVLIAGVHISVGDDCIAIKSGKRYMAKYHHKMTKNVTVRNCLLERGHGAVVVGSEASGGVDGVYVTRCSMRDTDRGLRVKTRRGRGERCVLTNIEYTDIEMERVLTPFVINMFYFCDPDGRCEYVGSHEVQPITEHTPRVGSLVCRHIRAKDCSVAGAFLAGLPERPIEKVEFTDVQISFAQDVQPGVPAMMDGVEPMKKAGFCAQNVDTLVLKNVRINGCEGEAMQLNSVHKLVEDDQ